jgi:hypothetical protein
MNTILWVFKKEYTYLNACFIKKKDVYIAINEINIYNIQFHSNFKSARSSSFIHVFVPVDVVNSSAGAL